MSEVPVRAEANIRPQPDGSLPECWLVAEWPPHEPEPTDYWLSNLPADTRLRAWSGWECA